MTSLEVTTTRGGQTELPPSAIQELKQSLRGELLQRADEGYDVARMIWNGMIDKEPALLVRCAGVADVKRAVEFARHHEVLVAVRGGGHNIAGKCLCQGGLAIDLGPMKGVRVDPRVNTARAQAGLKLVLRTSESGPKKVCLKSVVKRVVNCTAKPGYSRVTVSNW